MNPSEGVVGRLVKMTGNIDKTVHSCYKVGVLSPLTAMESHADH